MHFYYRCNPRWFRKTKFVVLAPMALMACLSGMGTAEAAVADSTKVVLTEGTNMAIDLSPDKKTIALDLQGTIWLMPATGGEAKAVTDALGDNRQPVWSPDGNWIAFQSFRDGTYHIWAVKKDGTGLKQLTFGSFDDREPHWSPDGKMLAFSSDRGGNYDIWQVDLASGQIKQLTQDPANEYCPAYAADGKNIAFVSERTAGPGIYTLQAGGKEQLLMGSTAKLSAPTWHPNGSQVLYNSLEQGQSLLTAALLGDGGSKVLSDPAEDVFPFRVSWVSSSEFLYTSDGKIKRRKLGKKGPQTIPFTITITFARPAYPRKTYDFNTTAPQLVKGIRNPKVSPDGSRIAFSALGDVWILKKGEKKPAPLTKDSFIEIDPAWSPDGKQLAYASDRAGNMDLWVRDLSTGKERCLLDAPEPIVMPVWSPDGSKIAFYQSDSKSFGKAILNTLEVSSGKVTIAHEAFFDGGQPSWSPDGKQLVLSALQPYSSRYREGISEFLLVSLEKQSDRFVTPLPERSLSARGPNGPAWSPDGSKMAYIMDGVLWVVPVDAQGNLTGPAKRLTNELAESVSWTNDSQSIVFLATDVFKQVYLSDGQIETIPMDFTWQPDIPKDHFVIHAGKVFDGRSATYRQNVDIIIAGNRIREIVPHQPGRTGTVIDATNKTVIPGLFEMHTHQNAAAGERSGRLWLAYGITSIREPGGNPYDALERKESWASGQRKGPRSFFTGGLMDGSRIYYGMAISNQTDAQLEMELDRAVRLGYDMIKTYVRAPDLMQQRITAFAHANGIPVSSHEIYPAIAYGVDAVEHMGATSRRGYSPKLSALNYSYQDVVQLLVKSGMNITPTASLHGGLFTMIQKDPAFFDNQQFKTFYSEQMITDMKSRAAQMNKINPAYLSKFNNVQRTVKALIDAGGRVTPGTDSPIIPPGVSLHAELQCWVDGGVSPYEALRSATLWSAQAVGVSKDLGTIEAGKLADLVIVEGDPLKNIKDVLNVQTVVKNGVVYPVADLLRIPK